MKENFELMIDLIYPLILLILGMGVIYFTFELNL